MGNVKNIKFVNMLKNVGREIFLIPIYSKAITKDDLIKIVKKSPKNPPIDLHQETIGPIGTPEEFREALGITIMSVYGQRTFYNAKLIYKSNKWIVK